LDSWGYDTKRIFSRRVDGFGRCNGVRVKHIMQKIFLWFLFLLGAIPPVLIINPIMERQAKIRFGYLMAIFAYMFIYLFAVFIAFGFMGIPLVKIESSRFLMGWGVGGLLTLCFTNHEVWDYVRPAIRSTMRGIIVVLKFCAMVTRNYVYPFIKFVAIKIYELVTKKKNITKIKVEEKPEEGEKSKNVEPQKTKREKSINDILDKLDNL
jgi:hypothetical protein